MPATPRSPLGRWLLAALLVLLALVALGGVGIAAVAANPAWLKPRLEAMLSRSLGRPVTIAGDLDLDLGRRVRLHAEDIRVANTDWGEADELAAIGAVDGELDLWDSLRAGQLVLPSVEVSRPRLSLERNDEGAVNWDLAPAEAAPADGGGGLPRIGRLSVRDATVEVRDAASGVRTDVALDRLELAEQGDGLALEGEGRVGDQPLRLDGSLGSYASLADAGAPFPVRVDAVVGGLQARLDGTVADPAGFTGIDLAVDAEPGELDALLRTLGLQALELPGFSVAGRLARDGETWRVEDLDASLGDLAVTGELGVATGGPRPKLTGALRSEAVDVATLRDQFGIGQGSVPGTDVIPESRLGLERLRGLDADVSLAVGTVTGGPLRLANVEVHAVLDDGRLRLDPLGMDMAGGRIDGTAEIDGSREPPALTLDLDAGRLRLERLLADAGLEGQGKGAVSGRLQVAGTGRSVQAIAASADGRLTVVMEDGEISMLLVEGLGIDPGDIVGVLLASSKEDPLEERYPLRCAILDATLEDGVARLESAVIDTPDSVITAAGSADLGRETLDLDLEAHPKDTSVFAARSPVHIGGRFGAVDVDADLTGLAVRGAAAVALGVLLTPFASILPFVDLGGAEDAPCGRLLREAERRDDSPAQTPKP